MDKSMGDTETYGEYVKRMSEFYVKYIPTNEPYGRLYFDSDYECDSDGKLIRKESRSLMSLIGTGSFVTHVPSWCVKPGAPPPFQKRYTQQCGKCDAMKIAVDILNRSEQGTKYEFRNRCRIFEDGDKEVGCGVAIKK